MTFFNWVNNSGGVTFEFFADDGSVIDSVFFTGTTSGNLDVTISSSGPAFSGISISNNVFNGVVLGRLRYITEPPIVFLSIDIKPGSDPNSINLCSNGAVPIAVLGSDTFDVNEVNTETLRFAEASVKVVGKKDPHSLCSYEDVNGDFITDLVCHFVTTDIAGVNGETTSATVNGELLDGTPIEGTDSVNIVKDTCN